MRGAYLKHLAVYKPSRDGLLASLAANDFDFHYAIVPLSSVDKILRLCFTAENTELAEFFVFFQFVCVLCGEIGLTTLNRGTIHYALSEIYSFV